MNRRVSVRSLSKFSPRYLPLAQPRVARQFIAGVRSPRIGPAPPLLALEPTSGVTNCRGDWWELFSSSLHGSAAQDEQVSAEARIVTAGICTVL